MAKQIGATEAYSFLNDAREMRSSTESYGTDLTTALVANYATERYGSESPENIRKTISDFNHYLTQQGSQGVNNMHDIVNGFVSGNGYGWGNTTNEVHDAMSVTKEHVQAGMANTGTVDQTAATASARTSGINQDSFTTPRSDIPMQEPDGGKTGPAYRLRDANRREEAGNGRVQTTAFGIAKEGVGKISTGLVDSQGNRLTSEGYFDEPPKVVDGVTIPDPGPIPKDAPSALGRKK